MPRRLRVLVLGAATAVAGGQEDAAGSRGGNRTQKAASTAAGTNWWNPCLVSLASI
jgi:hypothetical protein